MVDWSIAKHLFEGRGKAGSRDLYCWYIAQQAFGDRSFTRQELVLQLMARGEQKTTAYRWVGAFLSPSLKHPFTSIRKGSLHLKSAEALLQSRGLVRKGTVEISSGDLTTFSRFYLALYENIPFGLDRTDGGKLISIDGIAKLTLKSRRTVQRLNHRIDAKVQQNMREVNEDDRAELAYNPSFARRLIFGGNGIQIRNTYFPRRPEIIPPGRDYHQEEEYPYDVTVDSFPTVGGEDFMKVDRFYPEYGDQYRRQTFHLEKPPAFLDEFTEAPMDLFLDEVRCPWSGRTWGVFRRVQHSYALMAEYKRHRLGRLRQPRILSVPGYRKPYVPMSYYAA